MVPMTNDNAGQDDGAWLWSMVTEHDYDDDLFEMMIMNA